MKGSRDFLLFVAGKFWVVWVVRGRMGYQWEPGWQLPDSGGVSVMTVLSCS